MKHLLKVLVEAENETEALRKYLDGEVISISIVIKTPPAIKNALGPGTELRKLISKFGFKPKAGCKCVEHINEMNMKGAQWCRDNMDTIAGWLKVEAERAGYPFSACVSRVLITRAIKNAERAV